jgi:hypothetical protein
VNSSGDDVEMRKIEVITKIKTSPKNIQKWLGEMGFKILPSQMLNPHGLQGQHSP